MTMICRPLAIAMLVCCLSTTVFAREKMEPKTADAVVKADAAWGDAETRGDGDYLEQLLLPGYVSIGEKGKITTREAIISHARARGASSAYAAEVAAWRAAHPQRAQVSMNKDTAIVKWTATGANGEVVLSCDLFVYRNGHWRALYSQHTAALS
jgi:hypothetical protein